ncbi:MAG: hypothetical protein HYX66_08870 [Ignavibacteria bacterium]|nr:hypothetical protein [Ignavibacteria bacterium]
MRRRRAPSKPAGGGSTPRVQKKNKRALRRSKRASVVARTWRLKKNHPASATTHELASFTGGLLASTGRHATSGSRLASMAGVTLNDEVLEPNDDDDDGKPQLSDARSFTSEHLKRIEDLNRKLSDLDVVLTQRWRVYCSHNDAGYIVKRYVMACTPSERGAVFTNDLARLKPIGHGPKTLSKTFKKMHGLTWEYVLAHSSTEIRAELSRRRSTPEKKVQHIAMKRATPVAITKPSPKATVKMKAPAKATPAKKRVLLSHDRMSQHHGRRRPGLEKLLR